MDIGTWLRGLGLGRYEAAFRDNDVDAEILSALTADDLIGLGVTSIGHRRKLLAAIAALDVPSPPTPPIVPAGGRPFPNPHPPAGEGRVGPKPNADS
ncbi:MAG: SAM domain-containing protein [Stellaceae bacterium]